VPFVEHYVRHDESEDEPQHTFELDMAKLACLARWPCRDTWQICQVQKRRLNARLRVISLRLDIAGVMSRRGRRVVRGRGDWGMANALVAL
jgi:hypothetical protein